jgi:hypothetical protein
MVQGMICGTAGGCVRAAHRSSAVYSFREHGSRLARIGAQADAPQRAAIMRALHAAWLHPSTGWRTEEEG